MDAGTQENMASMAGLELVWRLACAELGVVLLEFDPALERLHWIGSGGQLCRWLGLKGPELELKDFLDFVEPRHRLLAQRSLAQGRGFEVLLKAKGTRWLQFRPMRDAEGLVYACRDNTEARRLGNQLSDCIERERQSFAESLHDDLCQQLVGISLLGHRLCKTLEECRPAEAAEAKELCVYLNDALGRVRRLSKGLSGKIESQDLGGLLQQLATDVQRLFKIQIQLQVGVIFSNLSTEAVRTLYQIVREAIYNAAKHCKGSLIIVSLRESEGELIAVVEDNGNGFGKDPQCGMGLELMKCRALSIGARLELSRGAKRGARIHCSLPLE